jgi:hypothetical protein
VHPEPKPFGEECAKHEHYLRVGWRHGRTSIGFRDDFKSITCDPRWSTNDLELLNAKRFRDEHPQRRVEGVQLPARKHRDATAKIRSTSFNRCDFEGWITDTRNRRLSTETLSDNNPRRHHDYGAKHE